MIGIHINFSLTLYLATTYTGFAMESDKIAFFRSSLKEARELFDKKSDQLSEIERSVYWLKDDIAKLRKTITALAAVCSESPWSDELGITDSCLEVMTVAKGEMSTQDVCEELESMGYDLASQKNPAASVHSVLGRLHIKGKIEKVTNESGSIIWRGPNYQSTEITDDDIPF